MNSDVLQNSVTIKSVDQSISQNTEAKVSDNYVLGEIMPESVEKLSGLILIIVVNSRPKEHQQRKVLPTMLTHSRYR